MTDIEVARQAFVDGLCEKMDTQVLTRMEITAIVEKQILDSLLNETIPELNLMTKDMAPGLERDNAELFTKIAEEFALGMARDLDAIMSQHKRVVAATQAHLKRIVEAKS
jgi:hypothetical protein